MKTVSLFFTIGAALIGLPSAEAAAPIVAGFERYGRLATDDAGRIEAGLVLAGELGCINCHAASVEARDHLLPKQGPMLGRVGERLRPDWLAGYLADPHRMKPGTTMPDVLAGLPAAERARAAESLAHYLVSTGTFADGWRNEPPRGPRDRGLAVYERSGCAACHGSRKAGAVPVPDRVPLPDLAAKWSAKSLEEFLRNPLVTRPSSRMPAVPLNEGDRDHLVALLMDTGPAAADAAKPRPGTFAIDAARAAEGRGLFVSVGCAGCHEMPDDQGKRLTAVVQPKPLADLASQSGGCLAPAPIQRAGDGPAAPWYGLDDPQRAALRAAIAWLATPAAVAPAARERRIDRGFTVLNCYACHVRDGKGGTVPAVAKTDEDGEPVLVDAARDVLFTAAVVELGDEARLPPSLTGVGDKLDADYLLQVPRDGLNERGATMHTRMPKWNGTVTDPLARLLAEDPKTEIQIPTLDGFAKADVVEAGRLLCGSKALGCIKCHAFDREKGQSLGLIDMTRMRRLRHEWFLAYVADPQHFRPGTRMPAAWPNGTTFFKDVLDGTAASQIESIWRYVTASAPRPPVGLASNPIELVPKERPIFYRNFITDAGPRAIGVGYPEKVNIAWDANALRLALVWKGGFIDANRHWSGRGAGWQPPLGDALFMADATTPLAAFASDSELATAAWPTGSNRVALGPVAGYRFKGYRLDAAGRPAFRWEWGECDVVDAIEPATFADAAAGGPTAIGLRRTLSLIGRPPTGTVALRAAVGTTIVAEADGWHRIDGRWRVRVIGGAAAVRRDENGQAELRVPLLFKPQADGRAEGSIVEELKW